MTRPLPASPEGVAGGVGARHILDVRGLSCPLPVLKARKVLRRLAPGSTLTVQATDPASVIDFRHFCETTPFELLSSSDEDGTFVFLIRTPG